MSAPDGQPTRYPDVSDAAAFLEWLQTAATRPQLSPEVASAFPPSVVICTVSGRHAPCEVTPLDPYRGEPHWLATCTDDDLRSTESAGVHASSGVGTWITLDFPGDRAQAEGSGS